MFKEPMDCECQFFPIELCKIYGVNRMNSLFFHVIHKLSFFFFFLADRCRIFGSVYNKAHARLLHLNGKSSPLLILDKWHAISTFYTRIQG